MAVEERHDPQDDCRCSPRTIVVGTVYVGTDSQSRDARSRQVSTNDLQRDMCRALWLSRTRIPALCLGRLCQTLRPFEPRQYWPLLAFGVRHARVSHCMWRRTLHCSGCGLPSRTPARNLLQEFLDASCAPL